jgi:methionine-rich copper-binding protein CopC
MRFTLTLVLFLILVAGGPKVQHFGLSNSIPAADSKIVSPGQLQLWFTQAPQEGSVTIRLVGSGGDLVGTGEPVRNLEDPKLMEVDVPSVLDAGVYTVMWRGIGDDGHVVRDEFGFEVTPER